MTIEQKAIKASDKKCVKGCSKYYRYGFQDGYIIGATETTKELQENIKDLEKQIAEAKEILREYVNWDYGDHTNCLPDITKKAEAFLKECV